MARRYRVFIQSLVRKKGTSAVIFAETGAASLRVFYHEGEDHLEISINGHVRYAKLSDAHEIIGKWPQRAPGRQE